MCLLAFAWRLDPQHPLVFIGNRDEYHARPAAPAAQWENSPVLAGRDLQSGGTWLGISQTGRFAVVTNYRHPDELRTRDRSRGELVVRALEHADHWPLPPDAALADYGGFNLIYGDANHMYWLSNRRDDDITGDAAVVELSPGLYGLSNHLLDTPWPKVQRVKARLRDALAAAARPDDETLFAILADRDGADDAELPDTGVGLELERFLAAPFIQSERYGTRASTIVVLHADGDTELVERRFDPSGSASGTDVFRLSTH